MTTYANWVAKTASLLADELDLERGQTIRIDLPTHWLGPVFLGAAWTVGLVVTSATTRTARRADPTALARWPGGTPWCSRARCTRSAPGSPTRCRPGSTTTGPRCGRSRTRSSPVDPPGPDDLALGDTTQRELWAAAAAGSVLADGGRVLTEENPASPSGLSSFTEPLVRGGSLVLVAHADPARLEATYDAERATASLPLT